MALVLWTYNNPRVDLKSLDILTFPFCGESVKIEQDLSVDISRRENTNYKLWDGSYLLASYIEQKGSEFWKGKRCLELGAGCGLVGIVTGMMGADVLLTDLPSAIQHTKHCLNLNNHLPNINNVTTTPYSWGSTTNDTTFKNLDFILGSDIVYKEELNLKLISTFKHLCTEHTTILLSYKQRGLGEEAFFEMLLEEGFSFKIKDIKIDQFKHSQYNIYVIKRYINIQNNNPTNDL